VIGKPLYENPLAGGQPNMSRVPNISFRRPNNPSSFLKPGFDLPLTLESADPNNLMPGLSGPAEITGLGGPAEIISGPSFISDTADKTLQNPYEFGGAGMLGLASAIDGSGGGALFLNDESRPRSEEDIRNRYEQAKAKAAESRRNGFLGQVVLPGESGFDQFKEFSGNSFFLKRNPNIPESAYGNFDLTDVGGFDNSKADPPMFASPGLPPPEAPSPDTIVSPLQTVQGPEDTLNPYNRVGQQLTGPDESGNVLERLKNIEEGIASLGQGGMNQSSFGGFNNNFGIGSFFPPYGGMYGQ